MAVSPAAAEPAFFLFSVRVRVHSKETHGSTNSLRSIGLTGRGYSTVIVSDESCVRQTEAGGFK